MNTKPGIFMNNEYYTPMDREYETGVLGYTHIGYVGGQFTVKNIKIDINEMKWVLNTTNIQPSSGSVVQCVIISETATSGSLSNDDWNKLRNMYVMAIRYRDKIYYLGDNDDMSTMYYYPHKPDDGFSKQYIGVPHTAPRWSFTQSV